MGESALRQFRHIRGRAKHPGDFHFRRSRVRPLFPRPKRSAHNANGRSRRCSVPDSKRDIFSRPTSAPQPRDWLRPIWPPFSSARVAAAAAFGFLARNFPFTITAQQYSSLYGASFAWSANVANLALGEQEAADRFRIGDRIDFALIQRQAEFARREDAPGDFFAGIDAIRAQARDWQK